MPDTKRTADSQQDREAPSPSFVVDFENQPHDTSFRIATSDPESLCGLLWMAVEAAKLQVSRLDNVQLLPGTIITVGGRRRELDGLVAADAPNGIVVAGVLEHKHDYDPRAQMQLCTNAAVAADELTRADGRFRGKTVLVLPGLVVHGPAAAKVPPTVEEVLKIAEGTEGGYFGMGPAHLLNLGEIPEERVYANPKRWALLAAIGVKSREVVPDGLIGFLFGYALRCMDGGFRLKGKAIFVSVYDGLQDRDRCDRLMREALGEKRGREMMTMTAEQMFPAWAAEVKAKAQAEAEAHVARGLARGEARGEARGLARGEARGEARGLARGEARGLAEGQVRSVLRIFRKRFGEVPDGLEERLLAASPEERDGWHDRALDAPSIDEAMKGNGSWGNGTPV